jgi:hypothetical protein
MIINLYGGNTDWPHNNWRTARNRDGGDGFKFYLWDTEFALGVGSDINTNLLEVASGVAEPWPALRKNLDFRVLVGDRMYKHFYNGGVLAVDTLNPAWDPAHPERNVGAARFKRTADLVERAMVGESARWGDMRGVGPWTRDEHWAVERNNLLANWFPRRSSNVVQQFRSAGVFPTVEAPVFNQRGGAIEPGFVVRVNELSAAVYYTLDGTDPRLPGGGISPSALRYMDAPPVTVLGEHASCRVLVPRDGSLANLWLQADFDDSSWREATLGVGYETETGFEPYLATSLEDEMYARSTTVFIRVPFQIENPASVMSLTLNMRYDDGFLAYINGRSVGTRNASLFAAWSSIATAEHADTLAVEPEPIRLKDIAPYLRTGRNVLAILGLNRSATSPDMLISATIDIATTTGGGGIPLTGTTLVRVRALSGGEWSPLSEAVFHVWRPLDVLKITEVMYHPLDAATVDGEAFEFIELKNTGAEPLDLSGVHFTDGVTFAFPEGAVLGAGRFLVLVSDFAAFHAKYPAVGVVFGAYEGNLSNGGERVALADAQGNELCAFAFDDAPPWPAAADGEGSSLVPVDPAAVGDPAAPEFWTASAWLGGSPGEDDQGGLQPGNWQRPGDINQDGRLDISDAVGLLRGLFSGAALRLPCEGGSVNEGGNRTLLDLNDDARVDVADAIYLLGYLFHGGPRPALGARCTRIAGCPQLCY